MGSNFQIKKRLLGGYKICYACPHCSASLTSTLDDAGNNDNCPQCNRQFVVPGKNERDRIRSEEQRAAEVARSTKEKVRQDEERERLLIEARQRVQAEQAKGQTEPKKQKQLEPPDDWLPDPLVRAEPKKQTDQAAGQTRACPYCGEEILAVAKKCKHCGEFLDKTLRQQQVSASTTPPSATTAKSVRTSSAGCGCLAVLIVVFAIIVASNSNSDSERKGSANPGNSSLSSAEVQSLNERWTKDNTPAWVHRLNPKVQTAFSEMMNDSSPLYTGISCNGKSTKVYVNRSEWRQLNRFQATNNLMLAVLLPHTDDTAIEYIDDNSGETLAAFTPTQSSGSIQIVHP